MYVHCELALRSLCHKQSKICVKPLTCPYMVLFDIVECGFVSVKIVNSPKFFFRTMSLQTLLLACFVLLCFVTTDNIRNTKRNI